MRGTIHVLFKKIHFQFQVNPLSNDIMVENMYVYISYSGLFS